jgi:hypothetical protein
MMRVALDDVDGRRPERIDRRAVREVLSYRVEAGTAVMSARGEERSILSYIIPVAPE